MENEFLQNRWGTGTWVPEALGPLNSPWNTRASFCPIASALLLLTSGPGFWVDQIHPQGQDPQTQHPSQAPSTSRPWRRGQDYVSLTQKRLFLHRICVHFCLLPHTYTVHLAILHKGILKGTCVGRQQLANGCHWPEMEVLFHIKL